MTLIDDKLSIIDEYINKKIELNKTSEENYLEIMKLKMVFNNIYNGYDRDIIIGIINKNYKIRQILDTMMDDCYNNDLFIKCLFDAYLIYKKENSNIESNIEPKDIDLDIYKQYIGEINDLELLSKEEEKILALRIKNGDIIARNELVEKNTRLVISIAKNYLNQGLSMLDLIQEGNIGLIEAAEKFDITRNVKFATFATYWIKQKISYALIEKSRNIKLSHCTFNELKQLKKVTLELIKKLGREPTLEEISEHMNLSKERIKKLISYSDDTVSYNQLNEENEEMLLNYIPSNEPTPEELLEQKEKKEIIAKIIKSDYLSETEKFVLRKRFGFENEILNYDQIGKQINTTGENVRQIIKRSIVKILKNNGYLLLEVFGDTNEKRKKILSILEETNKSKYKVRRTIK